MWPFDDEEETTQPVQQKPIDPQVKDYLLQKYSPEKRQEIEAANEEDRSGPNWLAGLSAFGAGLQGRDAATAGQNFLAMQEKKRQSKLDSFDKNRALAMQNLNDEEMLAKRKSANDVNSEESRLAQAQAVKWGMPAEKAKTLTAAQFEKVAPNLFGTYKTDVGIKINEDSLTAKKEAQAREDALKRELAILGASQKSPVQTPGQKALDTSFAKEYNDWTSGGEAAVDKNISRLEDAKNKLEKVKDDMFGTSGPITGRLPNFLRSEDSKTIQQDVQAAAQGALRATLGAQFTEKEGERIMAMAYDPTLSPEANIKKIDAAIAELKSQKIAKNSKAQHFDEYGTLQGLANTSIPKSETKDGMVRVVGPDGKIRRIPQKDVQAALASGGKLVDGDSTAGVQ